jgi:hypothetical protein
VWLCPRCGARWVTRNLWHSCVRVTLEESFARSEPHVLELARSYVMVLQSLGDVQVIPKGPGLSVSRGCGSQACHRTGTRSLPMSPCIDGWRTLESSRRSTAARGGEATT